MVLDRTKASLELLLSISRQLVTSLDLGTVLDRVLMLSIDNVGAERGTLIVLDENQNPVTAAVIYNDVIHEYTIDQLKDTLTRGLAGWVLTNKQAVLVDDTSADDRWVRRPDDSLDRSGAKSAICVPLMTRERLVGVLTMVHPAPGYFIQENLALLQAIADLAAMAIRNAQYYESMQIAHNRYYQLFEDSVYPILITSWTGTILEANRQASLSSGFSNEQLLTQNILGMHNLSSEDSRDYMRLLKKNQPVTYESELISRTGARIPVEVHVHRIEFQGVDSLQWILRDIRERKELDSLREDLTATIYHDLRAPLANIISSLDILQRMLPIETTESMRTIFEITNRSTERMQRLISSLLDINRLENGQAITNRKTADISEIIVDALEVILPNSQPKMQKINRNIQGGLPTVFVDVDMIRRVVINLLENAVKFTPINGSIEIGAGMREEGLAVWIADSGPGIPVEFKDAIFQKFTRIKYDNAPKGVGLGLAFCRLAINAHGGKIWVESESGQGSKFIFTLPVKLEAQF
jgi:PAS domain S-box-containing protein